MLGLLDLSGYDPVARRRRRRLLARARPLLLPAAVVLSALLLGGRLLPAGDRVGEPVPVAASPPAGRVLVVVTPADPAVLGLARPGAVVDVYGARDPVLTGDLTGPAARPAGLLVEAALVVGPAPSGAGPDPPPSDLPPLVAGPSTTASVVLAVTDEEARALAGQQGRGLSVAVRSTDPAPPDAGAEQPGGG